jgi:hypothetical protein
MTKPEIIEGTAVYHYTTGARMHSILKEGVLRLATENLTERERAAVWFSTNPDWERTVYKALASRDGVRILSHQELRERFGLYRIRVRPEVASITWDEFCRVQNFPKLTQGLKKAAYDKQARPSQWRCSWEPVGKADWLSVEVFRDGVWQELTDDEIAQCAQQTHSRKVGEVAPSCLETGFTHLS